MRLLTCLVVECSAGASRSRVGRCWVPGGRDFPLLADLNLEGRINRDDLVNRIYRFEEINRSTKDFQGASLNLGGG